MLGAFATDPRESLYPSLWDGLAFAFFPEATGPTGASVYDLGPGNRLGTLTHMTVADSWATAAGWVALRCREALNRVLLDRTGDQMFPYGSPFTVSAWVVPDAVQASPFGGYIIGDASSNTAASLGLRIHVNTNVQAFSDGNGTDVITASNVVQSGVPLHCAYRIRSNSEKGLFVNGTLMGTSTVTVTRSNAGSLAVGGSGTWTGLDATLRGHLLEAVGHTRALTDSEIRLLSLSPGIAFTPRPRRIFRAATAPVYRRRGHYHQTIGSGIY